MRRTAIDGRIILQNCVKGGVLGGGCEGWLQFLCLEKKGFFFGFEVLGFLLVLGLGLAFVCFAVFIKELDTRELSKKGFNFLKCVHGFNKECHCFFRMTAALIRFFCTYHCTSRLGVNVRRRFSLGAGAGTT